MTHPAPLRPLVYLLDIAALVVCCVGIVHIAAKPGLPVALESSAGTVYCDRIDDPVLRQMHAHEAVLTINGSPISSVDDVDFFLDGLQVGQKVVLTIKGTDGLRTEAIILGHYYDDFHLASVTLVSTLFFAVGVIVFWRKPFDPAARIYHYPVVKHIMDEHNGSIEVKSTPDSGSTFTLVFPAHPAPAIEMDSSQLTNKPVVKNTHSARQTKQR